ncbi:L,D-transpeptidase family protein [Pseudohalioglobus sediminis]|uniref:L,D-transpeptidase family protein n=1 Tax=Pseudohalioglobus sediminis TaxID=2606449 RepID=A0A5B0WXX1_9GAMM|nr:L,D-transpeptidase family protein [Pseudohalioglobus sediminis]
MKHWICILVLALSPWAQSATFDMPTGEFDLVGYQLEIAAEFEDTLLDIARRHGIGQEEIVNANPDVDRWLPGTGTLVTIPSRYILPDVPRKGLVLNLPEMRIYYFPEPAAGEPAQVQTYPVSIGRMDWNTPLGETRITEKKKDPPWYPPQSVREEHAREGDPLPRVVPPGPDNPLGRYAMRLAIPSYLIHGTNKAFGVGMRVSHGCIRMLPEDIEYLFPQVPVGTPVQIINQPVKAGWYGGELYVEVHPPLEEYDMDMAELDEELTRVLDAVLAKRFAQLDEAAVADVLARRSGLPEVVSRVER